jgi:hypothetical protein
LNEKEEAVLLKYETKSRPFNAFKFTYLTECGKYKEAIKLAKKANMSLDGDIIRSMLECIHENQKGMVDIEALVKQAGAVTITHNENTDYVDVPPQTGLQYEEPLLPTHIIEPELERKPISMVEDEVIQLDDDEVIEIESEASEQSEPEESGSIVMEPTGDFTVSLNDEQFSEDEDVEMEDPGNDVLEPVSETHDLLDNIGEVTKSLSEEIANQTYTEQEHSHIEPGQMLLNEGSSVEDNTNSNSNEVANQAMLDDDSNESHELHQGIQQVKPVVSELDKILEDNGELTQFEYSEAETEQLEYERLELVQSENDEDSEDIENIGALGISAGLSMESFKEPESRNDEMLREKENTESPMQKVLRNAPPLMNNSPFSPPIKGI